MRLHQKMKAIARIPLETHLLAHPTSLLTFHVYLSTFTRPPLATIAAARHTNVVMHSAKTLISRLVSLGATDYLAQLSAIIVSAASC